MSLPVKINLAAAGCYLLAGMLLGVLKYRRTMQSPVHRAPVYVDIAHRAAFLYSFAALVMARLVEENAYRERLLAGASLLVLLFFTVTILGYLAHGLREDTDNIFSERNFTTTWYMYALIAAEIGGFGLILAGFFAKQFSLG
jgi:hypothetical protein